jgi:PAS domain S-box-containing protein
MGWLETIHSDDQNVVAAELIVAVATRRPFAVEHSVSSQGLPGFAPDRTYLGYVAIASEATDHGDVNVGAREEPRALRRLIENAHDMVYRVRFFPTHVVEYVGGAVLTITGHTAAEFYADPNLPMACVHADDRSLLLTAENPARAPSVVVLRWVHPDGRVVHAEHRRVAVYDDSGQVVAIEGIARDVSEFVEAQRRLRESEDQLRQLAGRLHDAREVERAQVARELHDELGQTLTALKLDISRMAQALPRENLTPQIVDRLQSLIGLSDIGLATVKRIATTLRPPTLDHLGLAEAIHWEALTFKARTGLRCSVRTNKARTSLSSDQQTALFRILQEALTNVVRHAQASAVQVTLTERAGRFEMSIRDNGRGITESQSADPGAIGLVGMRERTALMGGTFRISGRRGKGTVVTIEVPVPARARTGRKAKVAR